MDKNNLKTTVMNLPKIVRYLSLLLGRGSMIYLLLFLIYHTRVTLDLGFSFWYSLLLDAGLSLIFFCQHSIMVRRSFKRLLSRWIPEHWLAAVFSISSGITLFLVIFFWQASGLSWFVFPLWWKCLMGICVVLVIAGFQWGSLNLPGFDPFGIRSKRTSPSKKNALKRIGPYQFVRHPMYFFVLVLIWSTTVPTTDRLMFNLIWTGWIFLGAWLEEKDLTAYFGNDYQVYQQEVSMIIPLKFKRSYPNQKRKEG